MRIVIAAGLIVLSAFPSLAAPSKKGAHTTSSSSHRIPDQGVLDEADLVALARIKAAVSNDQFSQDRTKIYVGREFVVVIQPTSLISNYDRETQSLTVSLSSHSGPYIETVESLELANDVKKSLYSGQNSFGAKTDVIKERGDTFGISIPGRDHGRLAIFYTKKLEGEAARALSKSIRLRLFGTVTESDSANGPVQSGLSVSTPTFNSPIDRFVNTYVVSVSFSKLEWIDSRTGTILHVEGASFSPAANGAGSGGQSFASNAGGVWLQLASGPNPDGLAGDFRRIRSRQPDLFEGIRAYIGTSGNQSRLLIGPFRKETDADVFAADLQASGVDALKWHSSPGDAVVPLAQ